MEENKNLEDIREIEEDLEERESLCNELEKLEDEESDICEEKRESGLIWGILGGAAVTAAYVGCRFAYKKGKGWLDKRKEKKKEKPIDTDYRECEDEDLDLEDESKEEASTEE